MRIVFEPDQYKDLYVIFNDENEKKELIFTDDADNEDEEICRMNLDDLIKICKVCNNLQNIS